LKQAANICIGNSLDDGMFIFVIGIYLLMFMNRKIFILTYKYK